MRDSKLSKAFPLMLFFLIKRLINAYVRIFLSNFPFSYLINRLINTYVRIFRDKLWKYASFIA